ncbi:MAG TPA: NADH-quinone oxidoreductase subunit N [Dehalococcoidales bacterium]|nr:NADH-quinone oxidoreductase subunit N [Dehalococcoidales bacterium]
MNLALLIPEIVLAVTALAVIILDLFIRQKVWLAVFSIAGLAVAAGFAFSLWGDAPRTIFYNLLAIDNYAIFFKFLFLGIAALVILASVDYVSKFRDFQGEFYSLILLATLGMLLMASAVELITIFLALELVNISMYCLVGLLKDGRSTEAALKYMFLSSMASAILLMGMAFLYGFTGQTSLEELSAALQTLTASDLINAPALLLGIILIIAGFGFKIATVPFHMWVPDVYEGAPTPVTAFLSVASKAAGFAVILRIFSTTFDPAEFNWGMIFAVLAAITMTAGNILAIQQKNIKRMLGYSSIAQAGYVMTGLAAAGLAAAAAAPAQSAVLFFLLCYTVANLAAFIAIIVVTQNLDNDLISSFSGLGRTSPALAAIITLSLISLIGLPPAAGLMAKFYIFSTAVNSNLLWLVIIAVLNSAISAYYYVRVIRVMWAEGPQAKSAIRLPKSVLAALIVCTLGMLFFGILPGFGMDLAQLATRLIF